MWNIFMILLLIGLVMFILGYFVGVWEYSMVANTWKAYANIIKEELEKQKHEN